MELTKDMQKVLETYKAQIKDDYWLCDEQLKKALKAGQVNLSTQINKGKCLQHKSRMLMYEIYNYWKKRRDLAMNKIHKKYDTPKLSRRDSDSESCLNV